MGKKIATGLLVVIAATAFVLAFGESDTILGQITWTGSCIAVLLAASLGLRALGVFDNSETA